MGHRHVSTFDDLVPSTYPPPQRRMGGERGGGGEGGRGGNFPWKKKATFFSVHTKSTRPRLVLSSNPRLRRRKTARHLLTGARQSYFFLMQNLAACSRGIKSPPKAGSAEELRTPNKISLRRPVRIPEGLHIMYSPGCARVEI